MTRDEREVRLAAALAESQPRPPSVPELLRRAADVIEALPGAAPVSVTVYPTRGGVSMWASGADDTSLRATVDAIAALLGLPPAEDQVTQFGQGVTYRAEAWRGEVLWTVTAPMSLRYAADHIGGAA